MDNQSPGSLPAPVQAHLPINQPGLSRPTAATGLDSAPPWNAKVEVYTRRFCADSMRTKGIFDRKNVQYNEYTIDNDIVNDSAMKQRTQGLDATPQVFIDGNLIGGLQQVVELDQSGELDFILGLHR
jgi:glutaredoxin 3